jgi:hypothetical protein
LDLFGDSISFQQEFYVAESVHYPFNHLDGYLHDFPDESENSAIKRRYLWEVQTTPTWVQLSSGLQPKGNNKNRVA